jgi:hypothetical protein
MNFLDNNPSLKRLLFTLAGAAVVALNKKLGLDLDAMSIASIAGMVVAYLWQSAMKEVQMAKVDAAAAVATKSQAAAELAK